jgi:MFS transporter, PAT family, beta-lactamase induction signal transducer AmpG
MPRRTFAPLWLMGLTNSIFGMYGGVMVIAVPQLLSARHVHESTIAAMTAVMLSPGFWSFLTSPVLDVRFSRRWYAVVTAGIAATLLVVAMLNLDDLLLVEVSLVAGYFCANLNQSAIGGWLSNITAPELENKLSMWMTIGNLGGCGAMGAATAAMVLKLPPIAAALLLGATIFLPTLVYWWMPAPGPDRRLASESFPKFFGEVASLLRRREILIAILIFAAPAATFSLTNFLAGVGADFHASPQFVGMVGGTGAMLGGICGCLIFPLIDRLLPLRMLYLTIGVIGAAFTLSLIVLPHTPVAFAVALIGENVFQGLAITAATAVAFEAIGRSNPLASTTFCVVISAFNIPISYMLFADGAGYTRNGITGTYIVDAAVTLTASLSLMALVVWLGRRRALSAAQPFAAA